MPVTFAGFGCLDPKALHRTCLDRSLPCDLWFGKANVFRHPAGRGPGTGAVLMTKATLDKINTDSADGHELRFEDNSGEVTFKKVSVIKAECVLPGAKSDPNNVYLVHLADRRHFFRKPIGKAFNVRNAKGTEYVASTKNGSSAWTWATMTTNIWDAVGELGTFPGLPFTPHGTPEGFEYWDVSAWDALNDVLARVGCEVVMDLVTEMWTIVRAGETASAQADIDRRLSPHRTWDAYPVDPGRSWRVESLCVLFEIVPPPGPGLPPYHFEYVSLDNAADGVTGVPTGSVAFIHDDMVYHSGVSGAAVTARATERAADWVRQRKTYGIEEMKSYAGTRVKDAAATTILGRTSSLVAIQDRGAGMTTDVVAGRSGKWDRNLRLTPKEINFDYAYWYTGSLSNNFWQVLPDQKCKGITICSLASTGYIAGYGRIWVWSPSTIIVKTFPIAFGAGGEHTFHFPFEHTNSTQFLQRLFSDLVITTGSLSGGANTTTFCSLER